MTDEYKDFQVYNLENDGTFNEFEITEDGLEGHLNQEGVLLIVKNELRRLWIWKGPRSPVRKRFISSKAASEIQETVRKSTGRQLKIVSVDAGEDPIEFLQTFNLTSMDASNRLEDLRYVRNAEREKLEQEQIKANLEKSKQKQEYWSPALEEAKREAAKQEELKSEPKQKEASKKEEPVASTDKKDPVKIEPVKPEPKNVTSDEVAAISKDAAEAQSKTMNITHSASKAKSDEPYTAVKSAMSGDKEKKIIEEVLKSDPPKGSKRMNIIIGQTLYVPSINKSVVLGKQIEKIEWIAASDLPTGLIDLPTNNIRVFIDDKFKNVKAIEIYQIEESNKNSGHSKDSEGNAEDKVEENAKTEAKKKSARPLPKIPSND